MARKPVPKPTQFQRDFYNRLKEIMKGAAYSRSVDRNGTYRVRWTAFHLNLSTDRTYYRRMVDKVIDLVKETPTATWQTEFEYLHLIVWIPPQKVTMTEKERNRQSFLQAIKEADWDNETPRLVYADWLDEQGEEDEATRQRKYLGALKTLIPYLDEEWLYRPENLEAYIDRYRRWNIYTEAELEARRAERIREMNDLECNVEPFSIQQCMARLKHWECMVRDDNEIFFGDEYPTEELQDPIKRAAFWDAFEILTGIRPSDELKAQSYYRCAC
jgi:uncharacterized protein (TIGR02996 family)